MEILIFPVANGAALVVDWVLHSCVAVASVIVHNDAPDFATNPSLELDATRPLVK